MPAKIHELKSGCLTPRILALDPSVMIITGDHNTPCAMKSHSWHPVLSCFMQKPVADEIAQFGERACRAGGWVCVSQLLN